MKKRVAIVLGIISTVLLGTVPAQASQVGPLQHFKEVCATVPVPQEADPDVCVSVNGSTVYFKELIEGLARLDVPGAFGFYEWQTDYIHLYRNANVVKSAGPTGWMSAGNSSFSTAWFDTCNTQGPNDYRAVWRGRARFIDGSPGSYVKINSGTLQNFFCGND
jgi:hypothetical protein